MYDDFLLNGNYVEGSSKIEENTANIDDMFNSLSDDMATFNRFISNISKQKKENDDEIKELQEQRESVNRAKADFENYVKVKNTELSKKESEIQQYLDSQKDNLTKAEEDFKKSMDNSLKELDLIKKETDMQIQKFNEEKEQFEQYKMLELNRIHHSEEILKSEKEQFEQYKEVNNQKIELETKNLELKFNKFKELIGQFNSKFQPVIKEEE